MLLHLLNEPIKEADSRQHRFAALEADVRRSLILEVFADPFDQSVDRFILHEPVRRHVAVLAFIHVKAISAAQIAGS